ncbi:TroA family protein [Methanosarcina horonobensis]|uniref:hypothetical protein n=1 Tax=Methanosarcina horonobensis TaxID=418008 RepID=UPI000A644817|nr:hypothetical protein [Methanosarcina horonobensis]
MPVKGITATECFNEEGFMGGYRISRAFGMVHGVLTCLEVLDDSRLIDTWEKISDSGTLMQVHHMIQQPYAYLEFVRLIAEKAGEPEKGEELISFIRTRLELVHALAAKKQWS